MSLANLMEAYRSESVLPGCLDALEADRPDGAPLIVVDNDSPDGSADVARRHTSRPEIVASARNLGFGGGCNPGVAATAADTVSLVNPDALPGRYAVTHRPGEFAAWGGRRLGFGGGDLCGDDLLEKGIRLFGRAVVSELFALTHRRSPAMTVSPQALISPGARIGRDVTIGPWTIVHDNVVIRDRVTIESHCVIGHPTPLAEGEPLVIDEDSLIRSHSIFYEGSRFGPGLMTGHQVTVRENFVAGVGLQIGTLCDFQGNATVGDYVRTHSGVQINHRTQIGSYVWIFPHVVLTNDPHPPSDGFLAGVVVEDYAVIAAMACVLPGVRIGTRSLIAAHSLVTKDVEPDTIVGGVPAKRLGATSDILLKDGSGRSAYPWMRHFHRGYPADIVRMWAERFGELEGPPRD